MHPEGHVQVPGQELITSWRAGASLATTGLGASLASVWYLVSMVGSAGKGSRPLLHGHLGTIHKDEDI